MQIEPATCPVCRAVFDPLRTRAVAVVDRRVRAYCGPTCLERARHGDGDPDLSEALRQIQQPSAWARLPREQKALFIAVSGMFLLVGATLFGRGRAVAVAAI